MNKSRVETFSDGVFAIVITLLILDVHIPEASYAELPHALLSVVPKLASYFLSFAVIGLYWVGHHYYFRFIKKVNNVFVWLNLFLLLLVSLLPFPTSLLGTYPFQPIPMLIYGINLLALNLFSLVMLYYIRRRPDLATPEFSDGVFKRFVRLYLIVNGGYLIAIALSFIFPVVSYVMYLLILAFAIKVYLIREE